MGFHQQHSWRRRQAAAAAGGRLLQLGECMDFTSRADQLETTPVHPMRSAPAVCAPVSTCVFPVSFGAHACRVWVQDDLLKDAGSKVSDFVQQVDWSRLQDVPVGVAGWVQQQGERLRTKGIVSGTPPEQSLCVVACLGSAPHWRCCCMVCQSLPHRWQRSTTCMTC